MEKTEPTSKELAAAKARIAKKGKGGGAILA